MATWEEVKRLAADFQKVQLSSTTQKLSERNCIEIISWLMTKKLVDLVFTTDGKEYMTHSRLVKEMKDELQVNHGRINFVELAKSIGVDLHHITSHVNEVLQTDSEVHSVLGQLIDSSYVLKIANEINDKLEQQGQISVGDLTIQYDLPAEFLQQHVLERYVGSVIKAKQDTTDPKIFFTESFITKSRAKMTGCLIGLSRPLPVATILHQISMTEKLFFSLFDQTAKCGFLTSRLPGALYIPHVYSRTQNEWVNNFYKQNGYLEYDALSRIGISDHKTYLKKQFANERIEPLQSCVVSKQLLERIEADIDECISSKSYVDLQNNVPSILNDTDIKLLTDKILTAHKAKLVVVIGNHIISKSFIENLEKSCESMVRDHAKTSVDSGTFQQYQTDLQVASSKGHRDEEGDTRSDKRDERRRKAAGGKSGGGTQGRETKTKSVKKLYKTNKKVEEDGEDEVKKVSLEIVSVDDIKQVIQPKLEDEGISELLETIGNYMLTRLNESGLEVASGIFATTVSDRTASRRSTHNDVQNKLNTLIGDIRLYEKGIKLFPGETQLNLYKYLLKTVCTEIVNELLTYISNELGSKINLTDSTTNEQRLKFANDLGPDYKTPLQNLIKTLSGQNVEDFTTAAEIGLASCSMILKKIDKKRDRVVVLNHKHGLMEQLDRCDDPALVLHLSSLIIFVGATQSILHASGRHVASILTFLKQHLTAEQFAELAGFHDLVAAVLTGGAEGERAREELNGRIPSIKLIANEYKKGGSSTEKN